MSKHLATSTQELHPWRAMFRTVLQAVIALALSAPLIVAAITGESSEAAGGALAVFLAASAVVTRLMAVPLINGWLGLIGLGAEKRTKPTPADPNLTDDYHKVTRDATLGSHSPLYGDDGK